MPLAKPAENCNPILWDPLIPACSAFFAFSARPFPELLAAPFWLAIATAKAFPKDVPSVLPDAARLQALSAFAVLLPSALAAFPAVDV